MTMPTRPKNLKFWSLKTKKYFPESAPGAKKPMLSDIVRISKIKYFFYKYSYFYMRNITGQTLGRWIGQDKKNCGVSPGPEPRGNFLGKFILSGEFLNFLS
jgi:hypothetical protein